MLGEEHKDTLTSLNNLGFLNCFGLKDYEGGLDYYQQALTVQEKVLGKTHPDALAAMYGMTTARSRVD